MWDREYLQGVGGMIGEQKMQVALSQWNQNTEEGRQNMIDYRNRIIKGIREAIPRAEHDQGL